MTTDIATNPVTEIIGDLAEAAVAAVGEAVGVALTSTPPAVVEQIDAADSSAFRAEISGPAGSGGLIMVLPAGGFALTGEVVDASKVASALSEGVAAAVTAAKGTPHQTAPPEPVDDIDGPLTVRFEIGNETGETFSIYWVVEASLGSIVAEGVPVTPSLAADPSVAAAAFPELSGEDVAPGPARDLTLLSDVPMNVTVELGKAVMQVRELLSLKEGSIVELDRDAGAAVDVLVNGTLVARGDVVVIDDDLGVRITEVVDR